MVNQIITLYSGVSVYARASDNAENVHTEEFLQFRNMI